MVRSDREERLVNRLMCGLAIACGALCLFIAITYVYVTR